MPTRFFCACKRRLHPCICLLKKTGFIHSPKPITRLETKIRTQKKGFAFRKKTAHFTKYKEISNKHFIKILKPGLPFPWFQN